MSAIGEAIHTIRRWIYGPAPEIPHELREASHRLNNESHELRCAIDRLKSEPDPFGCFLRRLREDQERDH